MATQTNLTAPHEVRDHAKKLVLAAHILRDGWRGAPLVLDGDETCLTGTHRLAACRLIEFPIRDIPTVDIRDVFAEADMDFDELVGESYDWNDYAWAIAQLPAAIRDEYGLDLH